MDSSSSDDDVPLARFKKAAAKPDKAVSSAPAAAQYLQNSTNMTTTLKPSNSNDDNARHAIEKLLTTQTSPGEYSTGSELSCPIPTVQIVLRNDDGDEMERKALSFPLDATGVEDVKNHAERAGVGLPDRTVVNLDVRKTWQIKPKNLDISNAEQALESALQLVARDLGTDAEYKIKASLYKLLLYEEGCFFARHRDNERLDGMFATLVLELPSEYEGAELSVWSPLTPNEKMTYTFNGGTSSTAKKRKTRSSNKPGLHFAAFYADCYHEVSELTSGHRAALIYHLTATPVQHPLLRHLRVPISSPPQPTDESVALRLSNMVDKFAQEADTDYPSTWEEGLFGRRFSWPGAPKKLVVVMSHHYTPASFTSIKALKGSDRSIAELVRAAAFKPPNKDDLSSLARLAAKKVTEVGGQQYASASECLHAHQLVSDEFNGSGSKSEPFFDAAIALAVITDIGEGTNYPSGCERNGSTTSWTTGPLINLLTGEYCPLDLGPKKSSDMCADYHPSWFGGQDDQGPPYQYTGPVMPYGDPFPAYDMNGPVIYGEQVWPSKRGNYSLPIYSHELLFASEEASTEYRKDAESNGKHVVAGDSGVKKLEFLGNGMPYMGRQYSRAVIMIWPKAHREDIKMQAKGNKEVGM